MNVWFTSDTHFNHSKIIEYCYRPYSSVEEMNRDLIARWNARVKPGDIVYHLGDVALGQFTELPPIIAQLNGDIELSLGNHDRNAERMIGVGIKSAVRQRIVTLGNTKLWLAHVPSDNSEDDRGLKRPEPEGPYDIELCGHVHSAWKTKHGIINVGVDVWDLQPISLEDILRA